MRFGVCHVIICIKAYQSCSNAKTYFLQDLSFINEASAFNVSCTAAITQHNRGAVSLLQVTNIICPHEYLQLTSKKS